MATANKSDAEIQEGVVRQLRWDTRVDVTNVGVEVDGGVVTLNGAVDSWDKRMAAQEAAHHVAGVRDVANDIQVRPPGSLARNDADIARAVRAVLEWDVRVPDERITSTVSDGCVTLEGTVDAWGQCEAAGRAVRPLVGVTRVRNNIVVTPPEVAPSEVRRAIVDALEREAQHEARNLAIDVADARVTLSGVVHSWAEREAVVRAASSTRGVRSVVDLLRVEPQR